MRQDAAVDLPHGVRTCDLPEAFDAMKPIPAPDQHESLREAVRALCARFDSAYWQRIDAERGYPEAFVDALTGAGWLAAMIPTEYGGSGLGLTEASVIMEEINRSGGNAGACHGQMYNMSTLLRHGSEAQKTAYLPRIASGELRLQSMAVTEPSAGSDTTRITTIAAKKGDAYRVTGQKVWISRVQHSDLMILLARTTARNEVARKSEGMSIFLVDVAAALENGMSVRPIANMVNHETNEVFFDRLEVPAENLIGEEGKGFRYILDGLNAERTLIAAECNGSGCWLSVRPRAARRSASDSESLPGTRTRACNSRSPRPTSKSSLRFMRCSACGEPCGAEANMAKHLAAKASWEAANACLQTHGGFGFAHEYDIERKFRETRLYQVAPISTNPDRSCRAEHAGMP